MNQFKDDTSRQSLLLTILLSILSCLLWGLIFIYVIKSPYINRVKNTIREKLKPAIVEPTSAETLPFNSLTYPTPTSHVTQTIQSNSELDQLEEIALDSLYQQDYPLFYYPVSQTVRIPDDFPDDTAQLPLVKMGEVTIAEIIVLPLTTLIEAAKMAGYSPYLRSGFRSINDQYTAYSRYVTEATAMGKDLEEAQVYARQFSAEPGYSEHNLGLAVDLLDYFYPDWILARNNYNKGLYLWLNQHAHEYGFVISYPTGNDILYAKPGSGYTLAEPWHLRFVGIELAGWLYDHEYLNPQNETTVNGTLVEISQLLQ